MDLDQGEYFPPKPYVVSDLDIYPSKTTIMSEVDT
jgi:hypothetical protein